jgi:hypothetical protein
MDIELTIAGLICLVLAAGHTTVGVVWVLPSLTEEHVPSTPFGRSSMTVVMIRVTWYIVTIFALALGTLLLALAWVPDADAKMLLLRWFAVMWLVATAMAFWMIARRMRNLRGLLRLPVPLLWIVVAVLCWKAST